MAFPRSSLSLSIALATVLFAGSVAAQPTPTAAPPGYSPAPPPSYGPAVAPPYAGPMFYPTTRLYSPALLITGVVASAVGSLAAAFGTAAYLNNNFDSGCFIDEVGRPICSGSTHGADTAVMVIGGIAMLAGIPMIALGSRRARVMPQDALLVPRITVSPRGGSLTFQF